MPVVVLGSPAPLEVDMVLRHLLKIGRPPPGLDITMLQ